MRLIARFSDRDQAVSFAQFLTSKKIDNTLEADAEAPSFDVWVSNEDRIEEALTYYEEFQRNPNDARFRTTHVTIERLEEEKEEQNR